MGIGETVDERMQRVSALNIIIEACLLVSGSVHDDGVMFQNLRAASTNWV